MAPTPRRINFGSDDDDHDDTGTTAAAVEAETHNATIHGNRRAPGGGGGGINDVDDDDDGAPEVVSTKAARSTALDHVNQQSELAKRCNTHSANAANGRGAVVFPALLDLHTGEGAGKGVGDRNERREKQSQRDLQGRERNLTKAASARVGLAQDVFEEAERLRRAKEEEEAAAAAAAEAARSKQRQKRRHLRSSDLDALTGDLAQEVKVGGFSVVPLPAVLERRRPLSKAALRFQKLKTGAAKVRRMPAVKTIARPSDGPAPTFVSGKKARRR
ncbi:hypothetical protein HK405_011222 [Cladochytrium tenue]|nr:hypothetical protein HK405_011222 [Cladochytrium tenue]